MTEKQKNINREQVKKCLELLKTDPFVHPELGEDWISESDLTKAYKIKRKTLRAAIKDARIVVGTELVKRWYEGTVKNVWRDTIICDTEAHSQFYIKMGAENWIWFVHKSVKPLLDKHFKHNISS